MDVHECIRTRRSTRRFLPDPVPAEKLQRVLEAVRWAPSWANQQPWEIVIVDDPEQKQKLLHCVPEANPGRKAVVEAPLVLAVCGRQGKSGFYQGRASTVYGDWAMFDVGIACQNLCLAAWAEGLGTLHLGLFEHQRAGQILGLPDEVKIYELIPLGLPGKESQPPKRREVAEFTHRNRFGG